MIVLVAGCLAEFPAFLGEEEETIVDGDGDGWSPDAGDCDDTDPDKHPEAFDAWYDGFDVDCAGNDDWDQDGDGYVRDGDEARPTEGAPGTLPAGDCDDTDAAANPGMDETCNEIDDNCDEAVDEATATDATTWYLDADADSYGDATQAETACEHAADRVPDATDCDDTHADAHPDAPELCDGYDNDCDSTIDEDDATDATTWYYDGDGDEWGVAEDTRTACEVPIGYAANPGDCVDTDTRYNPGADESDCADPNDYNCDGSTGYADADADGWAACEECDDAHADAFPGADELCDSYDNDCEGDVDEPDAVDALTWYADADGDKFGDLAVTTPACTEPTGYVADATDCDDTDLLEFPGANEYCDGDDDDCDSSVDEDEAIDVATWYADSDADGFGDVASTDAACDAPPGYVGDATDCDDSDPFTSPAETERCDDEDNDCDGDVDGDATDAATWYEDSDGDGYGDEAATTVSCDAPADTVADAGDCDDADPDIAPDALELCGDAIDNDCDGATDTSCDGWLEAALHLALPSDVLTSGCPSVGATFTGCAMAIRFDGTCTLTQSDDIYDEWTDVGITVEAGKSYDFEWCARAEPCPYAVDYCEDCGTPATVTMPAYFDDEIYCLEPPTGATCSDGSTASFTLDAECPISDQDGDGYDSEADGGEDCDDTDASVYPGATETDGDGVDSDCDGYDNSPFLDEDLTGETDGTNVKSLLGWSCDGTCNEVVDDAMGHESAPALLTPADNNATTFYITGPWDEDFAFSVWIYDDYDGSGDADEARILFHDSDGYSPDGDVLGAGVHAYGCGDSYCVSTGSTHYALGPRSEGWREVTITADYSSATTIAWHACVDGSCKDLTTSGKTVESFRIHHDLTATWMDEFMAWSL